MPDGHITDAQELLGRIQAFGDTLRERRRHERKKLLWAATVEVRGQRFEGMIVDLSPGGARIRFDAAVTAGDELTLMMKEFDALGAKVAWQREGEAGLQFLLAPEEVAARVQRMMGLDAASPEGSGATTPSPPARPRPPPARRRKLALGRGGAAAIAACGAAALIGGSVVMAGGLRREPPPPVLAITGGAADQHSCARLLGRVTGATNEIDFSLHAAEAAQAKCLDLQHLDGSESDVHGRMIQATKVPMR
jgi:hypothetical protein